MADLKAQIPLWDLNSRGQVHDLVVGFYRELVMDDLLATIFEEVAEVDWAEHIPRLIDYWCRVLRHIPGPPGRAAQLGTARSSARHRCPQ